MARSEELVIVFQGDSITDGSRGREGELERIGGRSYPFFIAGKLGYEWAERKPAFYNRGISGNRVSDLYARWNEDAIYLKPDILSILIGVNDAGRVIDELPSGAADRFEEAYRHLLQTTKRYLPETKLVLCEPFVLNAGSPAKKWEAWQAQIARYQDIVRQLAEEFGAVRVRLQEPFNAACAKAEAAYWLHGGVHPTAAGHELIAREWLKTVLDNGLIREG